jgi:hypothetical protein
MFALALAVTLFGPKHEDDDPEPSTYNTGTRGTEAAYLLVSELGYKAQRWDAPTTDLRNVDAAHTTLILTEPKLPRKDLKMVRASIEEFLTRGGRVLATGVNGALLLPGGGIAIPNQIYQGLCYTTPEGNGALARAGQVPIPEPVHWESKGAEYKVKVEQRCGADAVVVRFRVGDGEAIWWASPMPLTNAGLSGDPSLKLALASIGPPGQTVLFDEYLHTWHDSIQSTIAGLPWWPLAGQCAAAGALLLFSFSRRNGPLRMPVVLPRTSPIEFAESMGELYHKAGATQAATEAARGRLIALLREQCGIPREALRAHPPLVAQTLAERFGGQWSELESHLEQAAEAASTALAPKSALKLVQSLDADCRRLQRLRMSVSHSSRSCPMR